MSTTQQTPSENKALNTADMSNALADTTDAHNKEANTQAGDSAARAREQGWAEPEKYNYSAYNASSREEREAVESALELSDWASNAAKYEWKDEFGDIGPPHPELERQLFHEGTGTHSGILFQKVISIKVTLEGPVKVQPVKKFEDAGLHPIMLKNVELCGYTELTPIQAYVLPAVLKGYDVIGCAQTGSGKTAAYFIPTLSKLMGKAKKLAGPRPNVTGVFNPATDSVRAEPLILVVVPSRELATQIFDEARRLCYRSMLRPCVAYGGAPVRDQREELQKGCDVLIATPGRLIDFMDKPHLLSMSRLKYTIIDEADEMLNVDWTEDLKKIMSGGDSNEDADHSFMMFSATFPKAARALAKEFMAHDHVRIRVGRAGSTHLSELLTQTVVFVDEDKKRTALYDLLMSMPPSRTIVFVNNKRQADFLDDFLYNQGLPSTSIHADRTQREREDALRAFRAAKAPILVATGVSARGLDVKNVMHVINYDLPNTSYGGIDEYVHRIGRTARIGNIGLATSFYNDRNEDIADALVKVLMETKQPVPDFLQQHVPADGQVNFDDDNDSDHEGEVENNGTTAPATQNGSSQNGSSQNGSSWQELKGAQVQDAWGSAPAEAVTDSGWGASTTPSNDAWTSQPSTDAPPTVSW